MDTGKLLAKPTRHP